MMGINFIIVIDNDVYVIGIKYPTLIKPMSLVARAGIDYTSQSYSHGKLAMVRTDRSRIRNRDHPPKYPPQIKVIKRVFSFRPGARWADDLRTRPRQFSNLELQNKAAAWFTRCRVQPSQDGPQLMFQVPRTSLWGTDKSDRRLTPDRLVRLIAGQWPDHRPNPSPTRDEDLNTKFLRHTTLSGATNLFPNETEWDLRRVFAAGLPVMDLVIHHSTAGDTWNKGVIDHDLLEDSAKMRGLSLEYLEMVTVKEYLLGVTSNEGLQEIRRFTEHHIQKDYREFAILGTSLDCEDTRMCDSDFARLTGSIPVEGEMFELKTVLPPGEKWVQVPTKIMFGNGMDWAVIITTIIITADETDRLQGQFARVLTSVDPDLVKLLHDLPVPYGLGIRADVLKIEKLIRAITRENFEMDDFVDLSSWAVAAGFNEDTFNMNVMAYELLGVPLNKRCSQGDNKWGHHWDSLPPALRVYALADLKFGFQAALILFSVMIKNWFPDPDIVLAFTRSTHREFGVWLGALILQSLKGVEVKASTLQVAVRSGDHSLIDSFLSLRYREKNGDQTMLSDAPPARVWILHRLYGDWPSITRGGCRFLLQARHWFLEQHAMLTMHAAFGWKELFYPVSAEMREAAVYGIVSLDRYDFWAPTRTPIGLAQHPLRERENDTASVFPFKTLSSDQVFSVAKNSDGARRELVYEAARLDPWNVAGFLDRLPYDPYFMQWPRSYYLEIQNIAFRATADVRRHDVPELHDRLIQCTETAIRNETDRYLKVQEIQAQRIVRIEHLRHEVNRALDPALPPSTASFRGQLPPVGKVNPSYVKGSRRDLPNAERIAASQAYQPPEFGEDEIPYINETEYFPLGRAPARSGKRIVRLATSSLARDEIEEPANRPPPEDDWEMVQMRSDDEDQLPTDRDPLGDFSD